MRRALIHGEKVYLRPIEEEDINAGWHDWINDGAVNAHLAGVFPQTREDLSAYLKANRPPNAVMFAICDNETDTFIGTGKLGKIDWINRRCEYGRMIGHPDFRSRGYGSDALVLMLRYAFYHLNLNRVESAASDINIISLRSNEKVGMKREGVLRQYICRNGKFYDAIYLAITLQDFEDMYGKPNYY